MSSRMQIENLLKIDTNGRNVEHMNVPLEAACGLSLESLIKYALHKI